MLDVYIWALFAVNIVAMILAPLSMGQVPKRTTPGKVVLGTVFGLLHVPVFLAALGYID